MSYGLKYIIPFKTISEAPCEVNLEVDGFAGEPMELKAGESPFRPKDDTLDLLAPIRSWRGSIQVFGSDYLQDLYASGPQGIRATLYENGLVKRLGYLTPDTFSQDFSSPKFIYEMEVVAALSTLKYKEFDLTDDFVTFREIIAQAVVYAGYEFAYLTNSVRTSTGSYLDLKISSANFYDELGEAMTYYEVLEEIAKYLGCCFTPHGADLYLLDYAAIRAGHNSYTKLDGLTGTTVTLSDAKTVSNYRGTGAKLSRIAGKNKATINCSLYEIKNILPEFNDEKATYSTIVGTHTSQDGDYTGVVRKYVQPRFTFFHYAGGDPGNATESSLPVFGNNAGSSFVKTAEYETKKPPAALSMLNELQVKTYTDRTAALNGMHLDNNSAVLRMKSAGTILVHKDVHFCISLRFKRQTNEYTRSDDRKETYASDGFAYQKAAFRVGEHYYNGTTWTTTPSTFGMKVIYEKDGKKYGQYRPLENTNSFDTGLGDLTGYVFKAPSFLLRGECELILYCIEAAPVSPLTTFGTQYLYYRDIRVDYAIPDETSIYSDWVDKDSKNDIIYENVIEGDYVEEADEIDLKICTNPDGKLALSSVIQGSDGYEDFLGGIVTDVYGAGMAEHILLARVTDLYNSPRYVIDPTLKNDAKPYTLYVEPHLNKTFVVAGGEEDVKMENCTYNLIEI
jgi:hypothetical protein